MLSHVHVRFAPALLVAIACSAGVSGLGEQRGGIGDTQFPKDNPNIRDVGPLRALRYIGQNVRIDYEVGVRQLSLFDAVETVGGSISIANDPALTTVSGSALRFVGGNLDVTNDPVLASCPLRDPVTRLATSGWSGSADFTGTSACATAP